MRVNCILWTFIFEISGFIFCRFLMVNCVMLCVVPMFIVERVLCVYVCVCVCDINVKSVYVLDCICMEEFIVFLNGVNEEEKVR